jgi:hypothetical protein
MDASPSSNTDSGHETDKPDTMASTTPLGVEATSTETDQPAQSAEHVVPSKSKDWRFWAILVALAFTGLLSALEGTITSTALPSIVEDLGGGDLYIWAVNGYFLAM